MNNLLTILLANNLDYGFMVALVGFSIVIAALTIMVFVFSRLPKLLNMKPKKIQLKKKTKGTSTSEIDAYAMEGNVAAAISLALHLYFDELHDEESNVVTIKKVKKAYSPWSSKIYSTTQNWPSR